MVAWWFVKDPGLNLGRGLSVWSLHVLPMLTQPRAYVGFLRIIRLIGGSKLPVGVTVSVYGCSNMCGPVMDWRPVQGVLLPFTSAGIDSSRSLLIGLSGYG